MKHSVPDKKKKLKVLSYDPSLPINQEDTLVPEEYIRRDPPDETSPAGNTLEAWPSPEEIDERIDRYFEAQAFHKQWFDYS